MWRFISFVAIVIFGMAVVFYYTGMNEQTRIEKDAKHRQGEANKVTNPLAAAKVPVQKTTNPTGRSGSSSFGGAITITGVELKPKEEQEMTCEIDSAPILDMMVEVGSQVRAKDLMMRLDDEIAREKLIAQEIQAGEVSDAKIAAAENEFNLYSKEYERSKDTAASGATSKSEMEIALARREQARLNIAKSKSEKAFEKARLEEVKKSIALYQMKSRINGTVVKVFKKAGNNVRQGEPILHIVNDLQLTADGAVESGFATNLKRDMVAVIEPENDREARFIFDGHTGPVTGLVMAPGLRFMASSSEDGSVILWNVQKVSRLPWHRLERPDRRRLACRALAVSPAVVDDTYHILGGFADGSVYLWTVKIDATDLIKSEAKAMDKAHDSAVQCIAFRSDGAYAATGGDDRKVAIWDLAGSKKLYWVHADAAVTGNAHFGAVTSVNFSKDGQFLLTWGTDNVIRRWKLGTEGSELVAQSPGRTGDVAKMNMSEDGRFIFSDHGDELRILDAQTLIPVNLVSSRRSGRFTHFAQLSPSGTLAVAPTDQGRNLLLRLPKLPDPPKPATALSAPAKPGTAAATPGKSEPTPATPAETDATPSMTTTELWHREGGIAAQFTLPEAVHATCAVFGPENESRRFIFLGSTDNKIRVWELPTDSELKTPILARLKFVSPQVESGTGLVRVQAEFDNSGPRKLETGKRVTMIVFPDAADQKK